MPQCFCLVGFDGEATAPKEPINAFNSRRTKVPSLELGSWEPNESHGLGVGVLWSERVMCPE